MKLEFKELNKKKLNYLLEREYLVTNGLGSFSSSTISGMNTRKYHGLLISANNPPASRKLLFSKVNEVLTIDGTSYQLDTNQWKDESIAPQGYKYLDYFSVDPYPTWVYKIGDITLTKKIILFYGKDILQINYKVQGNTSDCKLKLVLLVNHRNFHNVTKGESDWYFNQKTINNGVILQAFPEATPLCLNWTKGDYERTEVWYYNYLYNEDKKRGLEFREDNYNPGNLIINLVNNEEITLTASTEIIEKIPEFNSSKVVLDARLNNILDYSLINNNQSLQKEFTHLLWASDQFLVKRVSINSKTVIAGYHWFADWGRDSLISLPGLTLVTKRFSEAKSILKTFSNYLDQGLIPNSFSDNINTPEYNAVDSSLWFFYAVMKYLEYTGDDEFVYKNIFSKLKNIIENYIHGTKYNIKMDEDDFLISASYKKKQLTWMDAITDELVITPRAGKPVEVNILWFNALKIMELLCERYKEESFKYKGLAKKVKSSINKKYWNSKLNCLYDCINTDGSKDDKIRPNQIFSISLPFNIFSDDKELMILEKVQEKLLTPFGLRTLSPDDKDYKGIYQGNAISRDSSYHQGTVWPWLMGFYITAYLKLKGRNEVNINYTHKMLEPLLQHLIKDACIGNISEIFDGNEPHNPKGCIAQAWSVSELTRCLVEDVYGLKPPKLSKKSEYISSLIK